MNTHTQTEQYLLDQIAPLRDRKAELLTQAAMIDHELNPLETTLSALQQAIAKEEAKAERNAKKADILPVCKELVTDNPGIDQGDLVTLAKERLTGPLGFSHHGLGSNLKRCLKEKMFRVDDCGQVTLAEIKAVI